MGNEGATQIEESIFIALDGTSREKLGLELGIKLNRWEMREELRHSGLFYKMQGQNGDLSY